MKKGVIKAMALILALSAIPFSSSCGEKSTSDVSAFAEMRAEEQNENLSLPSIFANGMILQRNKKINIYGKTKNGEKVTAAFDGKSYETTASEKNGYFIITLPSQKASFDTHTLKVESAGQEKVYEDILIGDVFLCGGQSNMELPMNWEDTYADYYTSMIPSYDENSAIKQFLIAIAGAKEPSYQVTSKNGWEEATHANLPSFSPLAYYFARELYASENVPVGLIMASAGATSIQFWIGAEDQADIKPSSGNTQYNSRSTYYNKMVYPVLPFTYAAVLWYQGEANADFREFEQYPLLQQRLVSSWRREMCDTAVPFYICELAGINDDRFAAIREGQIKAANEQENVYLVPNYDLGDIGDLHPRHKDELAKRILLLYKANTLKDGTDAKVPVFESAQAEGEKMKVTFKDVSGALKTSDGKSPEGFYIAGEDGKYFKAAAEITGEREITLSASGVAAPKTVRYALRGFEEWNLTSGNSLPPLLFRTDDTELKISKGANRIVN